MFNLFKPAVPTVSPKEVFDQIQNRTVLQLLDVRTNSEFARGHLPGSVNLPVDEIVEKVESVMPDKNARIYVYCLSGSRSVMAVDSMVKLGYTQVFDMENGLLGWRAKQLPI